MDPKDRLTCEDLLKHQYFDKNFTDTFQEVKEEQKRREKMEQRQQRQRDQQREQREKQASRATVGYNHQQFQQQYFKVQTLLHILT